MIRTLIVEDEILARLGLHQLVDWNALGFELLEDAKTGKEAIDTIKLQHPQVILLDLNIPEMDGIQIQKYIQEHHLRCYTIVVSCNDEFATVKDVMRYGAYDFLRKLNLTPEALTSVLLRCKKEIEKPELQDESIRYNPPGHSAYEALFTSKNKSEIFLRGYECLACIVPRYGGLPFWETFDLFASWLEQQKVDCFLITKGEKGIYLLLHKTAQTTFYQKLYQAISEFSKATVHIVVYEASIASLETLSNAFAVVDCAYVYAYYDLEDHIFFVSEKQKFHTGGYPGFQEDLQQIRQALSSFSRGTARQAIQTIFRKLRTSDMLAENVLKRMFMDILGIFSATAQQLHGSIESVYLNGDNYHYQNVIRLNSLEMTERMFLEFADIFFNAFFIPYKSEHSDILKKTFCYIDDNIDKPIQLASVAQAIGISESYLSTFFKREIGKSFVTYVTARKLEKAKLLLQKGDLAYQVSEALGFENYWNSNGEAQALYDEMQAAAFKYTKATGALFHSYHRYYNDGDLPGWARSRPDVTRYTREYGYGHRVLTAAGEAEFERRITERIQIEHRRFQKARRTPA